MHQTLALCLLGIAALGLVLGFVQVMSLWRHLREAPPKNLRTPGISVLKPLCGLDDDLLANLETFCQQAYEHFEILLGVKDANDAAYQVARNLQSRYPSLIRVVLQKGHPGMNPKVNQLMTLADAARFDILVVSDSNVRVAKTYLNEIAAHLEAPDVGLVTHAITGAGEQCLGSLMDNLHLTFSIAPGVVAASRIARQNLVVGKSMAFRRADLIALGGFASAKDILAEDYYLGRQVGAILHKRVAIAKTPITNFSASRQTAHFFHRYKRWSVLHRQLVSLPLYLAELVLNPIPLLALAVVCSPEPVIVMSAFMLFSGKLFAEWAACEVLGRRLPLSAVVVIPIKDVILLLAWVYGLFSNRVKWRGNRLTVLPGTRLASPPIHLDQVPADQELPVEAY